jgi:Ni,Fe-hydrogenase I small subunit
MRIPDEQLDLFAKRLEAIGVGRRDFLKVVGAMAAFGGLGFATTAQAAKPSKPGPNEKALTENEKEKILWRNLEALLKL